MGDSQHTQNIQINKVIAENEKHLLFYVKNHTDFLANPISPCGLSLCYAEAVQLALGCLLGGTILSTGVHLMCSWEGATKINHFKVQFSEV